MANPKDQPKKLSIDKFAADSEADYGIWSKKAVRWPLNGDEEPPAPNNLEAQDQPGKSEKPIVDHVEDIGTPYWDSKNVVRATRNLSPARSSSEKIPPSAGLWQRRREHYKRHWMLYTVRIIIFLAMFLPIVFLVICPAIAQKLIPAGLTVDLKLITLSLYTNDSGPTDPYVIVNLPEYHLRGTTAINITGQTVDILDEARFEEFIHSAVANKEFTLSANGSTTAYLGVFKAPIKSTKQVKLTDPDGTNLVGNITLLNPTVISLELGNVTLNMIISNITMGQGRIENVLIVPGNNTIPIRATFDLKTALQHLAVFLQAESGALTKGNVVISASGNSTIYNGVHIPYYEAILNNIFLTGEVPLIKILVDTLEQGLSTNGSLISSVMSALNGTSGLSSLLGELLGNKTSSTLLSGLSSLF